MYQKTGCENEHELEMSVIEVYNILVSRALMSEDNIFEIKNPNTEKVILRKNSFLDMAQQAAIFSSQTYSPKTRKVCLRKN